MTTIYGIKLYFLRYKGDFRNYLDKAENSQWLDIVEMRKLQKKEFINIARYASEHVPFYKEMLKEGIEWDKYETLESLLNMFPVLKKKTVKENAEEFISDEYIGSNILTINTSGTTGSPLIVYTNKISLQKNYAYFTRFLHWTGCDLKQKSITFAGRTIVPPQQTTPPYWRRNIIMNNTLFSSYHLSEENIPCYIEKMEEVSPVFIDSYPSAISLIAEYILKNNINHRINPKAIVTSSETLFEHQRDIIEQAFNCKVYDQYGSAEMSAFISQCEYGFYHVNDDYCILEVLDDNDHPVENGEPGRLICTGFINKVMPLIRYDIGDTVCLSDETCPCGRNMTIVKSILGRTDDMIRTPDGHAVGRLDPVFKGVSGIRETQIAQVAPDICELRLVKDVDFTEDTVDKICNQLRMRLGKKMKIEVKFMDEIPRTRNGKFLSVLSEI